MGSDAGLIPDPNARQRPRKRKGQLMRLVKTRQPSTGLSASHIKRRIGVLVRETHQLFKDLVELRVDLNKVKCGDVLIIKEATFRLGFGEEGAYGSTLIKLQERSV